MTIGKNRIILIFIFLISLVFLFTSDTLIDRSVDKDFKSLITDDYNGLDIDSLNNYDIEIDFFPNKRLAIVDQAVDYINKEDRSLNDLYFDIYPNALRDGIIDLREVRLEGVTTDYKVEGDKDTLIHIELDEELESGDRTEVQFVYRLRLTGENFDFENWYPRADGHISNYNVEIKTPVGYELATNGHIWSEYVFRSDKIWNIEGALRRNFTWMADPSFEKIEKRVEGTDIKLYFLEEVSESTKEQAITWAENALTTFNKIFGQYPYSDLTIVESDNRANLEELESSIVKKVASQWWNEIVASDKTLISYSEQIYLQEVYGEGIDGEIEIEELYQILSEYYDEYKFKTASEEDFLDIVDKYRD